MQSPFKWSSEDRYGHLNSGAKGLNHRMVECSTVHQKPKQNVCMCKTLHTDIRI
jgi:hypothetical protein